MIEDKIKHPSKTDFCLKQFQFPCNVSQFVQGEETGGDNDIGDISIGHHGVICHQHQNWSPTHLVSNIRHQHRVTEVE